ncbi:NACHT, LRR and PYD domains-containing protein 1b allele 2 [Holothuria leucospilota]|uniref:NACHT, LRR and PYD domains-containing protein 1b allele 2 n=1 Tax=Holothuria leucospilota TaxID=206669 RepID=A0A9Q1BWU2_HOLLE|nr:NACHT, LRR and PYD domains-containing protein 1b allele 2 [Holothuria leucospilota]
MSYGNVITIDASSHQTIAEYQTVLGNHFCPKSIILKEDTSSLLILWSFTSDSGYYSESEYHITLHSLDSDKVHCKAVTVLTESARKIAATTDNKLVILDSDGGISTIEVTGFFQFDNLIKSLSELLRNEDCIKLCTYFEISEEQAAKLFTSRKPGKSLLNFLEGKRIFQRNDVVSLHEAFAKLDMSNALHLVEGYLTKTKTPIISTFEKFVAEFSTFLKSDLFDSLCDHFNISESEKSEILSNNAPGFSLLALLKAKNVITPTDVSALAIPAFANLKQVVAKINRYQRDLRESKISLPDHEHKLTLEEKADIFIYYLHLNIKSWYESICPLPWKKASHWGLSDLFIACGLTLTNTKSHASLKNVDAKCIVTYDNIFTHSVLQDAPRIVVEGSPGSGKTMLASQIAYDWMEGKFENIKFAIFLQLKYVEDMTIPEAITKLILPIESPLSKADVEALLENTNPPKVCLILDGLEEYTGGGTDSGSNQSEVMKVMCREKLPNTKVIITTRSEYLQDLPKCPMLKIRQFGKQERDKYVEKLFQHDIDQRNKVIMAVENNPLLLELCDVPLLFVMAVHNIERIAKVSDDETEKVTPFVRNIIQTLCTMGHEGAQLKDQLRELKSSDSDEEESIDSDDSEIFLLTLEEVAFNGLCTGKQQLSWPMNFVQDKIRNARSWIDSGILIVEEEIRRTKKRVTEKTTMEVSVADDPSPSDKSREDLLTEMDIESKDMRPEIKDDDASITVSHGAASSGDKQHTLETNIDREISKNAITVLQARFLHKIIQEWFAAKHLSYLLEKYNKDEVERCLNLISPIELHYVLRFACGISFGVSPLILTYLNRYHHGLDNDKQRPVADCICQCFLEHSGDHKEDLKEIVTDFCKTGITIYEEDSRLLQKAKISLLNFASENKILVLKVKLVDVCQNLLTEGNVIRLYLNSGVYLPPLQEVHSLTITSWGPQLQELGCELLLKYLCDWPSLHEADFHFPVQPPRLEEDVIHKINLAHIKVTWTIGAITHCLHETGEWRLLNLKGESAPRTYQQQIMEDEPSPSGLSSHRIVKAAEPGRTEELEAGQRVEGYHSERKRRRLASHETTVQEEPLSLNLENLRAKGTISQNGGCIQVPDSSVKLRIPPNAFWVDNITHSIKMRIIPRGTYDEPAKSFTDNSSVMAELLPNNLSLRHPAELTLPHCLQLREVRKCRVSIYVSHHDEGCHPSWEEITNTTHHELSENDCKIWLDRFCWVKYEIDGEEVEAKKLIVYTAGHKYKVNTDRVIIDVGYYPDLIGANESLQQKMSLRNLFIADRQPFLFRKKPKNPLQINLEETTPDDWRTTRATSSPTNISYFKIASSIEQSLPFVLQRQTEVPSLPVCIFILSQGEESTVLSIDMAENGTHREQMVTSTSDKEVLSGDRYPGAMVMPADLVNRYGQMSLSPMDEYPLTSPSGVASLKDNVFETTVLSITKGASAALQSPPSLSPSSLPVFDMISFGDISTLAKYLDPENNLHNDWRTLADRLTFKMNDIELFGTQRSPTIEVIKCAMMCGFLKSKSQLIDILKEMKREDAAKAISDETNQATTM